MARIVRTLAGSKFNLDTLTDTELDTIISNTQAQQAQMTALYNSLINERVRRGLKLPVDDRRYLSDSLPASF